MAIDLTPEGINTRIEKKERELRDLQSEHKDLISQLINPSDPQATVEKHIDLLKRYNRVRDASLVLFDIISNIQQTRVKDVMDDYGLSSQD